MFGLIREWWRKKKQYNKKSIVEGPKAGAKAQCIPLGHSNASCLYVFFFHFLILAVFEDVKIDCLYFILRKPHVIRVFTK